MRSVRVGEITGIWSYLKTIDWSEPWFRYLGAFHILCVILTVQTRNRGTIQALYFGVMLLLVYSAEFLNGWAAQNYGLFSQQQYFDSNGMFISLVFSVPILVNCLVIVIMWLWSVGNLIADVKRLKYRRAAVMHARAERAKNQ